MDQRQRDALDRHITGNYGEDQFKQGDTDDDLDGFPLSGEPDPEPTICGCGAPAQGGVCSEPDCVFNEVAPTPYYGAPVDCTRCHRPITNGEPVVVYKDGIAHADWSFCGARP